MSEPCVSSLGELVFEARWRSSRRKYLYGVEFGFKEFGKHVPFLEFFSAWYCKRATRPERRLLRRTDGVYFTLVRPPCPRVRVRGNGREWGQEVQVGALVALTVKASRVQYGAVLFEVTEMPDATVFYENEPNWMQVTPCDERGAHTGGTKRWVPTHAVDCDLHVPATADDQTRLTAVATYLSKRVNHGSSELQVRVGFHSLFRMDLLRGQAMVSMVRGGYAKGLVAALPRKCFMGKVLRYKAMFPEFLFKLTMANQRRKKGSSAWMKYAFDDKEDTGMAVLCALLGVEALPVKMYGGQRCTELLDVTELAYRKQGSLLRVVGRMAPAEELNEESSYLSESE